jgi:hypothetical protein
MVPAMTDARYPAEWECDVVLADGGTTHLRPLRTDDADQLLAFLTRLSDRSRMLRFFAPVSPQTAYRAARFDEVDYESTFGMVAELGDELIAVGTWQRAEDPTVAEVASSPTSTRRAASGSCSSTRRGQAADSPIRGVDAGGESCMPRVFHEAGWDVARTTWKGSAVPDRRRRAQPQVLYRRSTAEARRWPDPAPALDGVVRAHPVVRGLRCEPARWRFTGAPCGEPGGERIRCQRRSAAAARRRHRRPRRPRGISVPETGSTRSSLIARRSTHGSWC